ncbi:MAG TPA: GAF domain-containing protein [Candidatus Thermoplasmatota archaeon]|nr:GAF domain-containing protein [Candidatus Thermoplasmatota archaeon]
MAQAGGPTFADSLARGSPEPVLSVTPSGRVLSWTRRAEMAFGYSRAEAIGRQILTLVVPPEGVEDLQRAMSEALADGAARCSTMRRRKDGGVLPILEMRLERRGEGNDRSIVFYAGRDASDATLLVIEPPRGEEVTIVPLIEAPRGLDALWREAHDALSASFAATVMLQRLTTILVPRFADWVAADLLDWAGPARRVASAHREASLQPLLDASGIGSEDTPPPLSSLRVLRSAQPILQPTARPIDPADPDALRRLGNGAHLVLPLLGRTRLLGAMTFVRTTRDFAEIDVAWCRELVRRAALEIENALLADQVQRLRETTRHATERAKQLTALSSALSEALTPAQVTSEAVRHAREALGASGGAIAMLSTDHATFEVTALVDEAEALSNGTLRFPIHANFPLADAARSGDPVLLEQLLSGAPRYSYLAQAKRPHRALAAVPLVVDGRHVGALGLVFPERRSFSLDDVEFMRSLARHAADALERARLYGAERSARAQADAEARRSAFLADASRILASSFDYRATLESTARLCVPAFGDWCAVYLREKDGSIRPVAVVHPDATRAPLARELLWRPGPDPAEHGGVAKVLRTGKPEVLENVPDAMLATLVHDPETRRIMRELGVVSQVALPLVARGRTLGAIALSSATHRRLAPADLHLVEELARRAAFAVDNARLYHEVEDAYRRKEESVAALRESEERYRLLVDGAPDYALFLLDTEGRVASWNAGAERLLGYKAEEIVGKDTHLFYTEEDLAANIPAKEIADAQAFGRAEQEGWRIRKDGTRYWASIVVTALKDDKGNVRGYSKLHRDVTERRRAREELDLARQRVAQHEKLSTMGTLVSGVAHEIRTPLTAIANSIHLIRLLSDRGSVAPDALKRHTSLALEGVDRINALVQDLRRFKRVDSSGRAPTSLDTVVEEALTLFRAAHRGRIEVIADLQPTPLVEVDRAQLQQIVLNLLQNASEAMPHGGAVELRTGPGKGGAACVIVRDEGMGMTPEVKSRMFEEFFTTKIEGTGLGLSIVRRIMELHHGTIECESYAGKGTTFTLLLPAKA